MDDEGRDQARRRNIRHCDIPWIGYRHCDVVAAMSDWRWFDYVTLVFLISVAVAGGFASLLWLWHWLHPVTRWVDFRAVHIDDTMVGEPIMVIPDGDVHLEFSGQLYVTLRSLENRELICAGGVSLQHRFTVGNNEDRAVPLSTWTTGAQPECVTALIDRSGVFSLTSCIRVFPDRPFLGMREACVHTTFTIYPKNEDSCEVGVRVSRNGLYHEPGGRYWHTVTSPIACFETADEAEEYGFEPAGP